MVDNTKLHPSIKKIETWSFLKEKERVAIKGVESKKGSHRVSHNYQSTSTQQYSTSRILNWYSTGPESWRGMLRHVGASWVSLIVKAAVSATWIALELGVSRRSPFGYADGHGHYHSHPRIRPHFVMASDPVTTCDYGVSGPDRSQARACALQELVLVIPCHQMGPSQDWGSSS